MTVPECKTCEHWVRADNVCAIERAIFMDPKDGVCFGFDSPGGPCPAMQISMAQLNRYRQSDLEFVIENGRIVDVNVPWLPETSLLTPIPQDQALSFALFDEETTGFLTRSTDEDHPRYLACGSMGLLWGDFRILKCWGAPAREQISLTMNRVLFGISPMVAFLQQRLGGDGGGKEMFHFPQMDMADQKRLEKYWSDLGYQVGKESGARFLAYSYKEGRYLGLFNREPFNIMDVDFEDPIDDQPLEQMGLSTRCLGCGFDSGGWTAPMICPACNMSYPELRFEEES